MGYVIPLGFSRVTFEYAAIATTGSKPCWGFGVDVSPDEAFLDLMQGFWDDSLKDVTSTDYTLERIVMRNNFSVAERPYEDGGGRESTFQPPQVAALVKMSSGLVGRANRGRFYWPGVLDDGNIDLQGAIAGGLYTTLSGVVVDLADAILAGDGSPVILHSTEDTPTPVTSMILSGQVVTQRRRNRR